MSNKDTSALVDGILRLLAAGSVVGVGLTAPNAVQTLDKPLRKLLKHLDNNSRAREAKRAMDYMKCQGLVCGDYEHGLQLTNTGRERLVARAHKVAIVCPNRWDGRWRVILYDIPEEYKVGRNALISQLKVFGFWQLQRSVWVFPYTCRKEIEAITARYNIDQFVTYLETDKLDNQEALVEKFKMKSIM